MDVMKPLAARGRERLSALGLEDAQDFAGAFGFSEFLYRVIARLDPEARTTLLAVAREPLTPGRLRGLVAAAPSVGVASERGLALIALREVVGLMPTRASLLASSVLAETVLTRALDESTAANSGLVIFGLGKLGGRELNFYSDLDLVFAGSPLASENEEERRLHAVRRLVGHLEASWRIDLRLRPFGQAGALVMGLPAMEVYFQNHGREWERYAWLKARAVAGDRRAGREFLARLHPFIYRRYLDYHSIEALREIKRQIAEEAGASARDIKRGPGGIREIEFIVQVFQLVRGGREPALAGQRLRGALHAARRLALLGPDDVEALGAAYNFLRRVENRLQIENQTPEHRLPEGPERRARLAASLGFSSWDECVRGLNRHRDAVRHIFDAIFGAPARRLGREPAEKLWRGEVNKAESFALARDLGFNSPEASVAALAAFKAGRTQRLMSARARLALDRVAPDLIEAASGERDPDAALVRLLGLLAALVRRSTYLALLVERPATRERLAQLVGRSAWIAGRLAASPVALDELLDPRLATPGGPAQLGRAFGTVIAAATEADLAAAQFREVNEVERLKIAASLAEERLTPREAELHLSLLAERAVRAALALAAARMRERHGDLAYELLILAYGKLGSRELGFASDLDLVFVYETEATQAAGGLAAEVWLARLAQRTISLLSQPTPLGSLYTVDTRLRPEGSAGLLISRFAGWRRYQREEARLWERQALLRARPVAGSARLARVFRAERLQFLSRPGADGTELGRTIVAMRARVAVAGRARTREGAALLDGEFLAAWWLLEVAGNCRRALNRSGFDHQLQALAVCGSRHPAQALGEALAVLRAEANLRVLDLPGHPQTCERARDWIGEHWAAASAAVSPL